MAYDPYKNKKIRKEKLDDEELEYELEKIVEYVDMSHLEMDDGSGYPEFVAELITSYINRLNKMLEKEYKDVGKTYTIKDESKLKIFQKKSVALTKEMEVMADRIKKMVSKSEALMELGNSMIKSKNDELRKLV